MTFPTREQVLEWKNAAELLAASKANSSPEWVMLVDEHLCTLAFAAGAAAENEACAKTVEALGDDENKDQWTITRFMAFVDAAQKIRARRPA